VKERIRTEYRESVRPRARELKIKILGAFKEKEEKRRGATSDARRTVRVGSRNVDAGVRKPGGQRSFSLGKTVRLITTGEVPKYHYEEGDPVEGSVTNRSSALACQEGKKVKPGSLL